MRLLAVCTALLIAAVLSGCAASADYGSTSTDGATLVSTLCGRCHPIERISAVKKDQAGWTATVGRMRSHGLVVTDAQQAIIISYLTARDAAN